MMSKPSIIAIDGPAASGKTTVGRDLADALGYLYFDTGLMYRAVTYEALRRSIDVNEEVSITAIAEQIVIDVQSSASGERYPSVIYIDGHNVTTFLHTQAVDAYVSKVSAYAGVRVALTRQQRRIGERGRVVMVGRDIGTVVFPNADLKVYMEASVEERARRRWQDRKVDGHKETYEEVLVAMRSRDAKDSRRTLAPMRPAEDAIRIDTTSLPISAVLARVMALVEERNNSESPAQEGASG
jgi:cytidylate kinase